MSINKKYPVGYSPHIVRHFSKRCASLNGNFLLPYLKKEDLLLDCGCGPGSITIDFASVLSQGKVIGIDIEPTQIEQAQQLAQERNVQNVEFMQGDITSLPFEQDTFDVAFTHAVLWTMNDFFSVFMELKCVVKPGGIIACREPYFTGQVYYPESDVLNKFFVLMLRAGYELGCDSNLGQKLSFYFARAKMNNIRVTSSCEVNSSEEEREEFVQRLVESWEQAPWAKKIREKGWTTEEDVQELLQALFTWKEQSGAFISRNWVEVIGYV